MSTINDQDIRNVVQKYVVSSYTPTVILCGTAVSLVAKYIGNRKDIKTDADFAALSIEKQRWITTSISTGVYFISNAPTPFSILDSTWNFISDLLRPGKRLKMLREEFKQYIETATDEYDKYKLSYEDSLKNIQGQIDIINKRKPIMKDYILSKVSERLINMGIESSVGDYPMEHIDYRDFNLNDEFTEIQGKFSKLQNDDYTNLLQNFPLIPVFPFVLIPLLVEKKMRELRTQLRDIKSQTELIFEKMRSDIQKVDSLQNALWNIASIYSDINSRFIPAIEEILDIIDVKYQNRFSEIPDDLLCLLRSMTKILKEIAERRIVPVGRNYDNLTDEVIATSNNLSVEYENLQKSMSKAA